MLVSAHLELVPETNLKSPTTLYEYMRFLVLSYSS
jgi:hypothetical protein